MDPNPPYFELVLSRLDLPAGVGKLSFPVIAVEYLILGWKTTPCDPPHETHVPPINARPQQWLLLVQLTCNPLNLYIKLRISSLATLNLRFPSFLSPTKAHIHPKQWQFGCLVLSSVLRKFPRATSRFMLEKTRKGFWYQCHS